MSWQCQLIQLSEDGNTDFLPGDMYYDPDYLEIKYYKERLSPQYWREWADKRLPIVVILPNRETFCPDMKWGDGNGGYKDNGWTVTGEAPNITVSPSINCQGRYHGWLQNGVLSDDVEGRKF